MYEKFSRNNLKEFTKSHISWGLRGPLATISSSWPAQQEPLRASCTGPCPDGFWISTSRETPQTFLGNLCQCSTTLDSKSVSWCSRGTCCVSVCNYCQSLDPSEKESDSIHFVPSFQVFINVITNPLKTLFSIGWPDPALLTFPYRRGVSVP